jgi:hypothetical protein
VEKRDSLSVKSLWHATDTPSKPFVLLLYVMQRSLKSRCFVEQTQFSILTDVLFHLMCISCIGNLPSRVFGVRRTQLVQAMHFVLTCVCVR